MTQEVLRKLLRAMRSFEYDPSRGSFRGWLKTVTSNAVRDLARQWQRRNIRAAGDTVTVAGWILAQSEADAIAIATAYRSN